jgi:hypothetical protein
MGLRVVRVTAPLTFMPTVLAVTPPTVIAPVLVM